MTGEEIVMKARNECARFGTCGKFAGAATVEIMKQALAEEGIATSVRDVFVQGLPFEVDLVVPRLGADPLLNGLLYQSMQVACALEIKLSGLHSKEDVPFLTRKFERAKTLGVHCAYVTFGERQSYRDKATEENLRSPCFTLTWHTAKALTDTGDWPRLLAFVRQRLSAV
jgi:hypothetical protein